MIEPTRKQAQIIRYHGKPVFVLVSYEAWQELTSKNGHQVDYVPHEVVGYQVKNGLSLIAAWRKYKKMTQKQLAEKLKISQGAVAQIEKQGAKPQVKTIEKIAKILRVNVEQLMDD